MRNDVKFTKLALTLAVTGVLTACGGGGGGDSEPAPALTVPPEGTLLSTECDGTTLVERFASGTGEVGEIRRTPNSPQCGADTSPYVEIGGDCGGDLPSENFVLSPVTSESDLHSLSQTPGYQDFLSANRDYSFQIAEDTVSSGQTSERYEIRSGDCGGGDCDRERRYFRSESAVGTRNLRGWQKWYGFNFRLGENFDLPSDADSVDRETWIFQLLTQAVDDQDGFIQAKGNMFIGVEWETGHLVLRNKDWLRDLSNCDSTGVCAESFQRSGKEGRGELFVLAESGSFEDDWHSVVVDVTFDSQADVRVWLDGQCVVDNQMDTMSDGWNDISLKWGLYRSESKDEISDDTVNYRNSIYLDDVREGLTYDDIAF